MPAFDPLTRISFLLLLIAALSACAKPEVAQGINDPFEAQNRKNHAANIEFDKAILRPASKGYGNGIPEGVRNGVSNFASNLSIPGAILNDLLQFHIGDALHNTARLLVNTTVGIGGIFDPASSSGLEARDSNFGETLHVWGFGEGAYAEHVLLGPSTTRDTIGGVVDLIFDPLSLIIPGPERLLAPVAAGASVVGARYKFSETVDSVLYDSEDSYAQARLFYLESRRFKLGGSSAASDDELYDIYEESYE